MSGSARNVTTWALLTRSCGHAEPVRVAGHYSRRNAIIDELRRESCSPCVGWPTLSLNAGVIAHDLRRPGTYPSASMATRL